MGLRLGLFDGRTGNFANGMPVEALSSKHYHVMSIMSHQSLMFNTRLGTTLNKNYGLPHLPEIFTSLPTDIDSYSKMLETSIYAGEPRIQKVIVAGWSLNTKGFYLQCCLLCTLSSKEIVKFRFKMVGGGRNVVEPWSGE